MVDLVIQAKDDNSVFKTLNEFINPVCEIGLVNLDKISKFISSSADISRMLEFVFELNFQRP